MISNRCVNCGKRVEWLILGINLGLFLLKGGFALISHSRSLMTDSFQSLANLIITVVVLISLKMASKSADEKFPYGYGKVEFLASGLVNMLLMIAATVYLLLSFSEMLLVGPEKPPKMIAIIAACISIIANLIAFGYGRCAGEKLASAAIMTNAEVNRADIATSVAVIVAVGGTNLGFNRLDHIVAIIICLIIIKVTFDGVKKAIKGLMDASLYSEQQHILNLVQDIEDIRQVGDVRARLAGRKLLIDMNVSIPSDWSLSRGIQTVQRVKSTLHRKMKNVSEVSVQLIPFDGADTYNNKVSRQLEKVKN